jgi:hypothetical protein
MASGCAHNDWCGGCTAWPAQFTTGASGESTAHVDVVRGRVARGGGIMLGYDEIKDLAKNFNARAEDFYALSTGNDPYYMVNNPHAIKKGEWFADLYHKY